jgi:hypothetical protein
MALQIGICLMTLSRVNDGLQEQNNKDDLQITTSLTSCSVLFLSFPAEEWKTSGYSQ